MAKIPWEKIRKKCEEFAEDLWKDEESEIRRIVDAAANKEGKVITVSFAHVIDCSGDFPSIKSKISFSEKFSASLSGEVDDPAQMTLEEGANGKGEKKKD